MKINNSRTGSFTPDVKNYVDNIKFEPQNPTLSVDNHELSISTGGTPVFDVDVGSSYDSKSYFIFSSVTGTYPGLPFGSHTLHANWDFWTGLHFKMVLGGSPVFLNFKGTLDSNGQATGTMNTYGPVPPEALYLVMYFCCLIHNNPNGGPWLATTNPVSLFFIQ